MYPSFSADIIRMNSTYELAKISPDMMTQRLIQFQDILTKECAEIGDIRENEQVNKAPLLQIHTELADLLGDIIVYCASEAERWGIPLAEVLKIIMASNFSKLDSSGKPIKDANDKFLKGPNYWKPEPQIAQLLEYADYQRMPVGETEKLVSLHMDKIIATSLDTSEREATPVMPTPKLQPDS